MKKHIQRLSEQSRRLIVAQLEQLRSKTATPMNGTPKVTNQNLAAHREEVLGSARKLIYPLDAPRHRIIKLSAAIGAAAIIGFLIFCLLALYRFQSSSVFVYGVTQVVPFPVAIIDNRHFVSYNDYLFELRHTLHYLESQQHVNFSNNKEHARLSAARQNALDQVVQQAFVDRLASQHHLSVSEADIDTAIARLRSQNRLGASEQVFESVLSEFWGWSVADFRRELKNELLAQKVVAVLDTQTASRAQSALTQLQQGKDFAVLAHDASDDLATKASGGAYAALIDRTTTQLPPQAIDTLFSLQPSHYSGIVNTGYALEIFKVNDVQGSQLHAAHIQFNFTPISTYTSKQASASKTVRLITP